MKYGLVEMSQVPGFSQAAENNKVVILEQLRANLISGMRVLEIGTGTAQHALYFADNLPDIIWQPSDRDLDHYELQSRLELDARSNLQRPITLDIAHWPNLRPKFDAVYSANVIHVMPEQLLPSYVAGVAKSLKRGGLMLLYGPFKYKGDFTTSSNAQFDEFLRATYVGGGIRDFEAVNDLAAAEGLKFVSDTAMPSNNQFLVWQKG